MSGKLDLDALERANLGRVVRPEDWLALLAYARALESSKQRAEVSEITEIIELMAADEEVDTVPKTALGQALKAQAGRLRERMREIAEVEYVLNCMDEGDRTGCGSKTDLGRDLEHQVQKLYEETDRLEEAQREVDSMRYQRDAWRADAERLDRLGNESWDLRSFCIGEEDVGWRVIEFHQAAPHERVVAEVYKDDPRAAIDAAMSRSQPQEGDSHAA